MVCTLGAGWPTRNLSVAPSKPVRLERMIVFPLGFNRALKCLLQALHLFMFKLAKIWT